MKITILALVLFSTFAGAQSMAATTFKCGAFGNDASARPFTLKVTATSLKITLDASGESSTADQVRTAGPVVKYTHFSKEIGPEEYAGQQINLLKSADTIAIPTNLRANPVTVRFYDSFSQAQWYTASCAKQ